MSRYLKIGLLAGLGGGCCLAVFLLLVGERSLEAAIRLEAARSAGGGLTGDEIFGRSAQRAGGAAGAVLYGLGLGALFGLVFAAVRHRLSGGDDWQRAVRLATAGWVAVALVPLCKYPPNPPGVGDPGTIGRRTGLFLVLLAWSVLSAWAAWRLGRWLAQRGVAEPPRLTLQGLGWVLLAALAFVALPATHDRIEVPANLLWRFRLASAGGQAVLWAVLGATFGLMAIRGRRPAGRLPCRDY